MLSKKIKGREVIEVYSKQQKLKIPVHIQPGQSDGVLGLALGMGRRSAGKIGNHVGKNAYPFILSESTSGLRMQFKKTGQFIPLANVQGHHSMEGRDIILGNQFKILFKRSELRHSSSS